MIPPTVRPLSRINFTVSALNSSVNFLRCRFPILDSHPEGTPAKGVSTTRGQGHPATSGCTDCEDAHRVPQRGSCVVFSVFGCRNSPGERGDCTTPRA